MSQIRSESMDRVGGGSSYVVQDLLSQRWWNGQQHYYVRWKGYPLSECTWEPLLHLTGCDEAYARFETRWETAFGCADSVYDHDARTQSNTPIYVPKKVVAVSQSSLRTRPPDVEYWHASHSHNPNPHRHTAAAASARATNESAQPRTERGQESKSLPPPKQQAAVVVLGSDDELVPLLPEYVKQLVKVTAGGIAYAPQYSVIMTDGRSETVSREFIMSSETSAKMLIDYYSNRPTDY